MFTLKQYRRNDDPATLAYRCLAAKSFEVVPLRDDSEHFARIDAVGTDGGLFEILIGNGEFVYVENMAGKTIDNIRKMTP